LAGNFFNVGGEFRNGFAAVSATTGNVLNWSPALSTESSQPVSKVIVEGNRVFVCGKFSAINQNSRVNLAVLDIDSGRVLNWNPNINGNVGENIGLMMLEGGKILVGGGAMSTFSGVERKGIASFHRLSGEISTWNANMQGFGVNDIELTATTVLVGGTFTNIGGAARKDLAELFRSSGLATTWNPDPFGAVTDIEIADSLIYVCGSFSSMSGQTRNRLAAFHRLSKSLSDWNPNGSGSLYRVKFYDGKVYCAGSYTSLGGQLRSSLARVGGFSGELDTWNPQCNGEVRDLMFRDSTLIITGAFTSAGGQSRGGLAEISLNSGSATSWSANLSGLGGRGYVLSRSGTTLFVGGYFLQINALTRRLAAALNINTAEVNLWNPSFGQFAEQVSAIASSDSVTFVGGNFSKVGSDNAQRVLTGVANSFSPLLFAFTAENLTIQYSGLSPIIPSIRFNNSTPLNTSLPQGYTKIAPYYWTLAPTSLADGIVSVPLSSINGVVNPNRLRWVSRINNFQTTWTTLGGQIIEGRLESKIYFPASTGDFAIADSAGGNTLSLNDETAGLPKRFELWQNHPNPFNPTTTIVYELPKSAAVKLELFDLLGRKVGTLLNARQQAGIHQLSVNASRFNLSSGIYFYRLQAEQFVQTKKLMLVK
jgi:hypothetical protein